MKTKLICLLALAASVFGNHVSAQDLNYTLDLSAGSKYVFRGIELGETTFHPSFELSKDDFYAGVWGAFPTEGGDMWSDEVDIYAGQSWAINETTSFDAGGTYYTYPGADDTLEVYIGVSHELESGVSVNGYAYRDMDLDTWTFEGSGGYSFPLSEIASLDFAAYIGVVMPDNDTDYHYLGVDAVVPIQINETTSYSFGVHWADHNLDGTPGSHFYGTASLTFGF